MVDSFTEAFRQSLLTEDDKLDVAQEPGVSDAAAFAGTLDKSTDPAAFDVQGLGGSNPGQAEFIETAKHWIIKLEGFSKEINGLEPSSLNSALHNLDKEGSVFRGIVKDMSADLVGIAETLAALSEQLKGYIIGAGKKQDELNAQQNV